MVAQEMVDRGVAVRQVARQLGVTEGALRYRLRRPGVMVDGRCDRATALDGWEPVVTAVLERFGDPADRDAGHLQLRPGAGERALPRAAGRREEPSGGGAGRQGDQERLLGRPLRPGRPDACAQGRRRHPAGAARAKRYLNASLLIVDEVGFRPLDRAEANLFFRLVSARYEKSAIILTSNKHVRDWPEIFAGDEILTTAILDRLLHHVVVVHIDGRSYRLRELDALLKPAPNFSTPTPTKGGSPK